MERIEYADGTEHGQELDAMTCRRTKLLKLLSRLLARLLTRLLSRLLTRLLMPNTT